MDGFLLVCTLAAFYFLRRGKVKLAGGIYLGGLWLALATAVALSRGIASPFLMGLTLIASISYWLFGRRAALAVSGCVCLSVIAAAALALFGAPLPAYFPQPPLPTTVAFVAIMALTIAALDLLLRELQRSLSKAHLERSFFEALFESLPGNACVVEESGRLVRWNRNFEQSYGSSLAGQSLVELQNRIHPAYRERVQRAVQQAFATGHASVELLALDGDGTAVPKLAIGQTFVQDGKRYGVGVSLDISERVRAEEALRLIEKRTRLFFERQIVGMAITSPEKGWLLVNDRLCQMLGYTREELDGMTWSQLTHPDDLAGDEAQFSRLLRGECEEYTREKRYLHKDGSVVHAQLSVGCVRKPDGSPDYLLSLIQDITERRRAEEEKARLQAQLLEVQKLESVGRLAGGVAHDFNNVLTAILGHAQLAMARCGPSNPVYSNLQVIERSALHSAELVGQLLAFARKQIVAPKVLDLNATVAGMLKMLQQLLREDIDFVWRPGAGLWPIKIDPSQVGQLLANLCVNARDAIGGLGKIIIETGNGVFDEAYCALHAGFVPGEYAVLTVSDDGCGMDKDVADHIFEPFFTTKEVGRGTGLGLAMVYGIVKQNDGFINLQSEPGRGTTFTIYLPRCGAELAEPHAESAEPLPAGHGETVLLVEDEELILDLSRTMLEQFGYQVLTAATPGEALRHAATYAGRIQLLITDVVMPEMNGRELADRIGKLNPGLKCIFSSGYTADVIAHRGVLDEGVHFLHKPFSMKNLAAKLREVLEAQ
jgi:PAS domain S-box-containing protein